MMTTHFEIKHLIGKRIIAARELDNCIEIEARGRKDSIRDSILLRLYVKHGTLQKDMDEFSEHSRQKKVILAIWNKLGRPFKWSITKLRYRPRMRGIDTRYIERLCK